MPVISTGQAMQIFKQVVVLLRKKKFIEGKSLQLHIQLIPCIKSASIGCVANVSRFSRRTRAETLATQAKNLHIIVIAVGVIRHLCLQRGFRMLTYLICPSVQNCFYRFQRIATCFKFQPLQVLLYRGPKWQILP